MRDRFYILVCPIRLRTAQCEKLASLFGQVLNFYHHSILGVKFPLHLLGKVRNLPPFLSHLCVSNMACLGLVFKEDGFCGKSPF